jgi:hypothetical protein
MLEKINALRFNTNFIIAAIALYVVFYGLTFVTFREISNIFLIGALYQIGKLIYINRKQIKI